jgi:hypothetical protein
MVRGFVESGASIERIWHIDIQSAHVQLHEDRTPIDG